VPEKAFHRAWAGTTTSRGAAGPIHVRLGDQVAEVAATPGQTVSLDGALEVVVPAQAR